MSLGSNGMDRERSLQKIPMRLRGTKFCINCTSSARFVSSLLQYKTIQNAQKHYETHQYMSLGFNRVDRVRSLRKILPRHRGTNFCTSLARFAPSFVRQPNGPECTQILRNTPKHQFWSDGADRGRSLRKIPTRVRGTNFCTSSSYFAPSFIRQPNGPNAPK